MGRITNHELRLKNLKSTIGNITMKRLNDDQINEVLRRLQPTNRHDIRVITKEEYDKLLVIEETMNDSFTHKFKTRVREIVKDEDHQTFGDFRMIHKREVCTHSLGQSNSTDVVHSLLIYEPQLENELQAGNINKRDLSSHFRI